jgi:hypothetical protein
MEMEHTLSLKDKQESAGEQYPGPALSEDVFHCGILIQVEFLHRYSQLHEPRVGHLHNPVTVLLAKVLLPEE